MDSFRGTDASQEIRFKDKEKTLLKKLKFPPELDKKVLATQRTAGQAIC